MRRESSTQTKEPPTSPAAVTEEAECQTDIQGAGEWERATRVAKRNAELSRKAAAAAKKFNSDDSPFIRKSTVTSKPGRTVKILVEPPKRKGT